MGPFDIPHGDLSSVIESDVGETCKAVSQRMPHCGPTVKQQRNLHEQVLKGKVPILARTSGNAAQMVSVCYGHFLDMAHTVGDTPRHAQAREQNCPISLRDARKGPDDVSTIIRQVRDTHHFLLLLSIESEKKC